MDNVRTSDKDAILRTAQAMLGARSILFITGAGISADSGLPTYRGIGGLYNGQATQDGMPIEEALSGETLRGRPDITWKYLGQIEQRCRGAGYNRAHEVIALAEGRFPRVWVLTQNIDGFHHKAGSRNVIDIHGNMYDILCTHCGWHVRVADYSELAEIPPKCPECRLIARPDVVFFGEMLSQDKCRILEEELARGFDLYFSIGTTSVFPYIQRPILLARRAGAFTVEINPESTEVSGYADIKIRMGAARALDMIWGAFLRER